MTNLQGQNLVIRYRGFLLIEQPNHCWLVRPERSPMFLLPFRTAICSLEEVKETLDLRMSEITDIEEAA